MPQDALRGEPKMRVLALPRVLLQASATMDWDALAEAAWKVREMAHAAYSRNFKVGAALWADPASGGTEGRIITGCNVENISFGLTMCAERVAAGTAVAAGLRKFRALAVVADSDDDPVSPCGACRQVLAEFDREGKLEIRLFNRTASRAFLLKDLLPYASKGILRSMDR